MVVNISKVKAVGLHSTGFALLEGSSSLCGDLDFSPTAQCMFVNLSSVTILFCFCDHFKPFVFLHEAVDLS